MDIYRAKQYPGYFIIVLDARNRIDINEHGIARSYSRSRSLAFPSLYYPTNKLALLVTHGITPEQAIDRANDNENIQD